MNLFHLMHSPSLRVSLVLTIGLATPAFAQSLEVFVNGQRADATKVNSNFSKLKTEIDVAKSAAANADSTAAAAQSAFDAIFPNVIRVAGSNVGIGSSNPSQRFQVSGGNMRLDTPGKFYFGSPTENDDDPIWFDRSNPAANESNLRLAIGDDPFASSNERFQIGTATGANGFTPQFTYLSNGRFGVGQTTPLSPIHIRGSGELNNGLTIESTSGAVWRIWNSGLYMRFSVDGANVARIDNASGNWIPLSDRRMKRDIQPIESALDRVMQLRPVTYNFKSQPEGAPRCDGFIAQEVQELFPSAVSGADGEDEMLGLSYDTLGVYAIRAIQEQQSSINELKQENEELRARLASFEALVGEVAALKAAFAANNSK